MTKILLILVMSLAVIHRGMTEDADHKKTSDSVDDDVSFIDTVDETEAIREKIRTEMDDYKRIKEMMFKNLVSSSTQASTEPSTTTTPAAESTTASTIETSSVEASTESSVDSTSEVSPPTSTEPTTAKSTLRPIAFNSDDLENPEETPEDATMNTGYDETTAKSGKNMTIEDRFIFNAPLICKSNQVLVGDRCKPIAKF